MFEYEDSRNVQVGMKKLAKYELRTSALPRIARDMEAVAMIDHASRVALKQPKPGSRHSLCHMMLVL